MKKFNWNEFKNEENKIAVHCKTEEEAKDFCLKMHEHGMKWRDRRSYLSKTNYECCKGETCYSSNGMFSDRDFYRKYGWTILEWSDYMQKEFTKADLKDEMVVEYNKNYLGKRLVIGDYLIGEDGYAYLESYSENLKCKTSGLEIVRVYKTKYMMGIRDVMKDQNLELIWERKEPKKMTVEEMRQK